MIVADTAIWVDYLNRGDPVLEHLLEGEEVLMHPFVRGEVALGNPPHREIVLADLDLLDQAIVADHDEVMQLIEHHRLFGSGIGYVDAHLLASTLLTEDARLWTREKRLAAVAARLGIAAAALDH
jgi:predicted nucleic acid-binding protein